MKIDDEWEIEDALRTLLRAEEIRKDKVMMKKIENLAKEKQQQMSQAGIVGKAMVMGKKK